MPILALTTSSAEHNAVYLEAETIISVRCTPSSLSVTCQKNLSAATHNIDVKHLDYIMHEWNSSVNELIARQMLEIDSEGFQRWIVAVIKHNKSIKELFREQVENALVALGKEADAAEAAAKKKGGRKTG